MTKLILTGKTDKYSKFRIEIDGESVGEVQIPDEKVMGFCYRLVDEFTIQ